MEADGLPETVSALEDGQAQLSRQWRDFSSERQTSYQLPHAEQIGRGFTK